MAMRTWSNLDGAVIPKLRREAMPWRHADEYAECRGVGWCTLKDAIAQQDWQGARSCTMADMANCERSYWVAQGPDAWT